MRGVYLRQNMSTDFSFDLHFFCTNCSKMNEKMSRTHFPKCFVENHTVLVLTLIEEQFVYSKDVHVPI